jgi:hypothetical protein
MNETDAKIYRLRAELIAAEAELSEAYTPAARLRCLKRYAQHLIGQPMYTDDHRGRYEGLNGGAIIDHEAPR